MAIRSENSIVPETVLDSPQSSPTPAVPIVTRTYGRQKPTTKSTSDASDGVGDTSMTLWDDEHSSAPMTRTYSRRAPRVDDAVPPSETTQVIGTEDTASDASPEKFNFGWKKRMEQLNVDSDDDDSLPNAVSGTTRTHVIPPGASRDISGKELARHKNGPVTTLPASSPPPVDVLGTTLFSLPGSSQPTDERAQSPTMSPSPSQVSASTTSPGKTSKYGSGARRTILFESDGSDAGVNHTRKPSGSIATRSPPVSDFDEDLQDLGMPELPKARPAKGKAKSKSKKTQLDVVPLKMGPLDESSANHAERKSKKSSIRAPSKRLQDESLKETARIRSERTVPSLPRPSASNSFTLQNFLKKIIPSNDKELSSDPIVPATSPSREVRPDTGFGAPSLLIAEDDADALPTLHLAGPSLPQSSQHMTLLPNGALAASDSDEDMPDIKTIVANVDTAAAAHKRRSNLAEAKQALLARRAVAPPMYPEDEDEDELEIVENDMKSVVREEDRARHGGGRTVLSDTRKRQLQYATGRADGPRKSAGGSMATLKSGAVAGFAASAPGNRTRKKEGMSKKDLDRLLLGQAAEENAKEIRKKEEDWVQRGGSIKVPAVPQAAKGEAWKEWAEEGLKNVNVSHADDVMSTQSDEGEEDGDYQDDEHEFLRGSASPEPSADDEHDTLPSAKEETDMDDEDEDTENQPVLARRKPVLGAPRHVVFDSDEEEGGLDSTARPTPRRNNSLPGMFGRVLVPASSVTQDAFGSPIAAPPATGTADLGSAGEDSEEDKENEGGDDKENHGRMIFSQGEDKENELSAVPVPIFTARPAGQRRSSGTHGTWSDEEENISQRAPLQALVEDTPTLGGTALNNDPFASPTPTRPEENAFMTKLRNSASPRKEPVFGEGSPSPTSRRKVNASVTGVLSPAPLFGGGGGGFGLGGGLFGFGPGGFSQFSQNAPAVGSSRVEGLAGGFGALGPGFADLFESPKATTQAAAISPQGFAKLRRNDLDAELALDFEPDLAPPVILSERAREKDLFIFQKEQELLASEVAVTDKGPDVWVNTQGFLTQTKPSSTARAPPSPSQAFTLQPSPFTQKTRGIQRQPLGTLAFSQPEDPEQSSPGGFRRLRRAMTPQSRESSASPPPSLQAQTSAFDALRRGADRVRRREERRKQKLGKSEFVEAEAVESDDDAAYGFGPKKGSDDDESDDEDQDKTLEGLVDDAAMDEEMQAAERVIEKFKEHQEADDKVVEKIVNDAVQGRMRMKKRDRGLGFEDDESESDDDNSHVRRPKLPKKRRILGDTLDAYRQNEATAAFVGAYDKALVDEEDELSFLASEDVAMADRVDDDTPNPGDDEDERLPITAEEMRQRLREVAAGDREVEEFDPHNVSYLDGNDSDDELHVNVKEYAQPTRRAPGARQGGADADEFYAMKRPNEREAAQAAAWAKAESRSRTAGTGRSATGAAVTGHGNRTKNGGGSLRAPGAQRGAAAAAGTSASDRRPKQTTSMLNSAVRDRKSRFQ